MRKIIYLLLALGLFTACTKEIDFDLYDEFLSTQNRYINLKRVNKYEADDILRSQKEWAMKRYEYYKNLDELKHH